MQAAPPPPPHLLNRIWISRDLFCQHLHCWLQYANVPAQRLYDRSLNGCLPYLACMLSLLAPFCPIPFPIPFVLQTLPRTTHLLLSPTFTWISYPHMLACVPAWLTHHHATHPARPPAQATDRLLSAVTRTTLMYWCSTVVVQGFKKNFGGL